MAAERIEGPILFLLLPERGMRAEQFLLVREKGGGEEGGIITREPHGPPTQHQWEGFPGKVLAKSLGSAAGEKQCYKECYFSLVQDLWKGKRGG